MSAIVIPLSLNKPLRIFPAYKSRLWWLFFVMAVVMAVSLSTVYVAASGFGGFVSEYLMGRSGVDNSNLLIGSGGAVGSGVDVAMSGRAVTAGATNIYMDGAGTHATLSGNLLTLNGFPSVYVYFQWGYDGANYIGLTAPQLMGATGAFTADIAHFDPGKTVYYRVAVDADGLSFSSPSSFIAEGGIVTGFNLLNAVVVLAYIAMVIFVMIAIGSKSTVASLIWLAVAIYIGEAFVVAIQEALTNLF